MNDRVLSAPGHPDGQAAVAVEEAPSAAAGFRTARGHCLPFGATPRPGGVNFAVLSRHATAVHLVLFKEGRDEPLAEIPLDPEVHKTGDVWHLFVYGLTPDVLYGYRVFGPWAPRLGHRFNPQVVLLDPYAPAISGGRQWGVPDVP